MNLILCWLGLVMRSPRNSVGLEKIRMEHTYRLVIACPDRVGIVAKVTTFQATIMGGFSKPVIMLTRHWAGFMRNEIKAESLPLI